MPAKKKKYDSRFPPARIKKIMQTDEEVGKVAAVVPVIISRALEMFVETLLKESRKITISRNARTLTPTHLKASILGNDQFAFLKDVVSSIPDIQQSGDEESDVPNCGPSASGVHRRTNSKKK
ncbi:dr1-associated corepressor-like protein [Dinothrombium tinctorium]|uniref:Dr1-associated corepressor n=1 Tax=Dinothrombium tinctorium TaxID=1965070 RepID=A0A3S3NWN1_9ACAR|nr:dr1-associated corepressor-like protein [Dinothrombium tinctorium]RWS07689.1 dr1-associated corepressor-like protein [Dinothrombium tinctorium]RWS07690.1 dr1-associated corepressor-like protein [Dinothrombium tinctorium]